MKNPLKKFFSGDGTKARTLRSSAWVFLGFGGQNILRLASNLILTRLLFPEAFGLMALVNVFMVGLAMFSDFGLKTSIIQSDRGEDPKYLNTVWSIQILRGIVLWLGACALAYPAAQIYNEPLLLQLLPIAGVTAIIQGFASTKAPLANRYFQIGLQTALKLCSQVAALTITVLLTWITESIWSLVIGGLCGSFILVVSQHILLKGPSNRLYMNREMVWEVIHFGKFLFFSSIAGFLVSQGDRAILGAYVTMADLGIFTVGYLFASVPLLLVQAADSRILQPLYRKFLTTQSQANRQKISKARMLLLACLAGFSGALSLLSIPLIDALYDARYQTAGPLMALMGFSVTAYIATSGYDGAYLSHGDSRSQFKVTAIQAVLQVGLSFILIPAYGAVGAVYVIGLAALLSYPARAWFAAKYNAWDWKADALSLTCGLTLNALALWIWQDEIEALLITIGLPQ